MRAGLASARRNAIYGCAGNAKYSQNCDESAGRGRSSKGGRRRWNECRTERG
jgi:hypothetical protein